VFLELDRSTKVLGRIKANLKLYGEYLNGIYQQDYKDGYSAWVLYVVGSDGRRRSIERLGQDAFLPKALRLLVCQHADGIEWLRSTMLDRIQPETEGPVPSKPPV